MPANVPLTPTELARLLLDALVEANLSFLDDEVLATATIATTPSYPCTSLSISSPSAGWIGSHIDRTIVIRSAGGVLRGYYRLNAEPTLTTCPTSEIVGDSDGGLFADGSRITSISSSDIISILNRYDIDRRRPLITAGVIKQDGITAVDAYNQTPEPIVNITINGDPGDFASYVTSGTVHIVAVASVTKWSPSTTGGSTLAYAWTTPPGATNVTGPTTATCAFDLPSGDAYWLHLQVTDSIGGPAQASRALYLHNASYLPVAVKIPASDTRDRSGRKLKVIGPESILSVIPPGAKCLVWGTSTWGTLDVSTATKKFSGYMISRPFSIQPGYHESQAELVGPMGILEMLDGYGLTLQYNNGSTTTWNELASSISTVQFVTWWILRWRAANVLRCFDFTPLTTSNLTGRRKDFTLGPMKIAAQLQTLAKRADSNIGSRSDARIIHAFLPWMLEDRSGVVTRDTLTYDIYQDIQVSYDGKVVIKPIQVNGYYSDLSADSAVTAMAPGEAPEPTVINDKIYESPTDAQLKAGREYARAVNPYTRVTVYLPVNRDVYEPADMERVDIVVPAAKSPTSSQIILTCIPVSVSKVWLGGKRAAIRMDCEVETDGKAGIYIPPPPPAVSPDSSNTPPALPEPSELGLPTHDGRTVIAYANQKLGITFTWSSGVEEWIDITGDLPAEDAWTFKFDPFSPFFLGGENIIRMYALLPSGLYYCANLLTAAPVWVLNRAMDTAYWATLRVSGSVAGQVWVGATADPGAYWTIYRLTNFGATLAASQAVGAVGSTGGMDIDPFANEVLTGAIVPAGSIRAVYRVLNDAAAVAVIPDLGTYTEPFIQRPIYKDSAETLNTHGADELFYIFNNFYNTMARCVGATFTDITPATDAVPPVFFSSFVATDNPNVLIVLADHVWTSDDGGDNWTDKGVAPGSGNWITCGYFPRLISGNYAQYAARSTTLYYSPDNGTSWIDCTGDWASAIGSPGSGYFAVLPCY